MRLIRRFSGGLVIAAGVLTTLGGCGEPADETPDTPPVAQTPPATERYRIQLPSRDFTPRAAVPAELAGKVRAIASGGEKSHAHILVQLHAPVETADRRHLAAQGLTLLDPLNRHTWYAAVTPGGAESLGELEAVRWAGVIEAADKLAAGVGDGPLPYQKRDGGRLAYSVLFHKDVSADQVRALAKRLDAKLEDFSGRAFPVLRTAIVVLPADRLTALAEADIVLRVEPAPAPDRDYNALNAQPLSNVGNVQAAPYDLDGTGVAVGVWEVGDTVYAAHLDLTPRVTVEAGQTANNDDHAAHVAGTIGASGVNVANAEGMAPNVTLSSWDSVNDAAEMVNAATSPGGAGQPVPIQASNHSYGATIGWNFAGNNFVNNQNLFGNYNNQAQGFDNVVFNTGLVVVKAAGNDRNHAWDGVTAIPGFPAAPPNDCFQSGFGAGVAGDCISPRASAKNVITVGAMNGGGAIAGFSNYGPTDDGRIKPDLMAHGINLLSLACNCFDDRNGDGVDDVPNSTTSNRTLSGTSMSTPVVSGIAALVLQEAGSRNIAMTPAAVKALLVQTAQDVQGIGQSNPGPDYATGWGIADAEAAVNLLRQGGLEQGTLNATGAAGAWTQTFHVPAGEAEVHLTLAWDDPAAVPGAAQALINDLDLRLIAPDATVFTPWALNAANPAQAAVRNGGNDAVNNVEQVSVQNPMAGTWTVQVSANPGNLPQAPQNFAVAGLLPQSDVVLVMDRSGSMTLNSGAPGVTKLAALQSAADEFVDLLDLAGGHRLGLAQFEENLVPFAPPFDLQPLTAGNVGDAHAAIGGMTAGGWTNIIAGVEEAVDQLDAEPAPSPRQAVVVFSDGKHNRPLGSDLNTINATVAAGDDRFYSIGFGTDVDDAILTTVANDNGGIHVNEQDLSPIQLTKYFLTVGALVHDLTVLADPTYELGPGESTALSVDLSTLDHSATFAVNWLGQQAKDVELELLAPDKRCRIPLKDHEGLSLRQGEHYRLVRVELPYLCRGGAPVHAGRWVIKAKPTGFEDENKETVDIMILGDSRLGFAARAGVGEDQRRLLITARLQQDGKALRKPEAASVQAHLLLPLPPTGDSEKQDTRKDDGSGQKPLPGRDRRTKTLRLYDNGKDGDRKAGDGVFTAALDTADLKPGLVQARLVATVPKGKLNLTRETTVSFYLKR